MALRSSVFDRKGIMPEPEKEDDRPLPTDEEVKDYLSRRISGTADNGLSGTSTVPVGTQLIKPTGEKGLSSNSHRPTTVETPRPTTTVEGPSGQGRS